MKLNEVDFGELPPVEGYGPGFFRVAGNLHHGPLLLTPDGPCDWNGMAHTTPLVALARHIDVLFLGMGAEIAHPSPDMHGALEDAGLAYEIMATPAACRTYNVLLGEGRRIGAALMPV